MGFGFFSIVWESSNSSNDLVRINDDLVFINAKWTFFFCHFLFGKFSSFFFSLSGTNRCQSIYTQTHTVSFSTWTEKNEQSIEGTLYRFYRLFLLLTQHSTTQSTLLLLWFTRIQQCVIVILCNLWWIYMRLLSVLSYIVISPIQSNPNQTKKIIFVFFFCQQKSLFKFESKKLP